jgi:uncharacterized protein (PEP-CTERM system associated)
LSWESTLTDNVNLSADRKSDWVNQLTPTLQINEAGARTRLSGNISVPMLVYVRTGGNDQAFAQANLVGTVEAIDKFLFIDASANVGQQFASPFGAQPSSLSTATQNRYTAQTYAVSPYIKGELRGNVAYELRDTNTWTNATGLSSTLTGRSYQNELAGHLIHPPAPAGWSLDYDRTQVRFKDVAESERTEIERARFSYRVDPSVEIGAGVGYEDNHFFQTQDSGVTYSVAAHWRPNDRTNLSALWEHRFFGSAYDVLFDHTTRLSTWSIHASRNISNYPQQLATLPAGQDVSGLLNALFSNRFQDPAQRQAIVDQLIRDRGLPNVLAGPVPLLAQQITLLESASATMGLLGARNTVFFTVFRTRNEPIEAIDEALNSLLSNLNVNNTQVGANVIWTHQLAPTLNLATSAQWSRVTDNANLGAVTRMYLLRTVLSRQLSSLTSVYAGARYENSRSNTFDGFREAAVFVGVNYIFH